MIIIIYKLPPELNPNQGTQIIFLPFQGIFMHCMGRKQIQEKFISNCELTMPRLKYWQKEYTNAFIGVYKEAHQLTGSNSSYCSCKTNILDFDNDNDDDDDDDDDGDDDDDEGG